jgi:hypothetical protein
MLSKKAAWWISKKFITMVVLVAAVILIIIVILPKFWNGPICADGQAAEIAEVGSKVNGVMMQPGYQVVYFKMESCARSIEYKENGDQRNVTIKYVTTGDVEVSYAVNAKWELENPICSNGGSGILTESGQTYTFYVYAGNPPEVKCVGVV